MHVYACMFEHIFSGVLLCSMYCAPTGHEMFTHLVCLLAGGVNFLALGFLTQLGKINVSSNSMLGIPLKEN